MNETVIVGAGLAGAFMAAELAREGARPILIERSSGPTDKVCGEFLSAEAQTYLAGVGLDLAALGAAPVRRVRIAGGSRLAEATLPFPALGLSRRRLDEALMAHAAALGADVRRGVLVKRIEASRVETSAGDLEAERVVLASGKHDVRGAQRQSADADWGMVGFKTYFQLEAAQRAALDDAVEIVLFDGGYAGLQRVEDGRANLCLLVREAHLATLGRTWEALLDRLLEEPHLKRRLGDATPSAAKPLAIARLPFGFLRRATPGPGVYPVGDQAAVIASFTGDGMSIALHSARLAAGALRRGWGADRYLARLEKDLARPLGLASWLQRHVEAWPGRGAAVGAFAAFPPLLAQLARLTRIPPKALASA
jgi:flavin-dependent dehydrogenase